MRIALQLKVLGLNPIVLAMDNYFVDREQTPKDENGNYDFECLGAMDLKLLNTQLNQLFAGEEIEVPTFNFAEGKKEYKGNKMKMGSNDILIMEGIHALNPALTSEIESKRKFRIYASALTSISIDENNSISTTDNRMLRRMVRDNNFRGTSAEQTILRWASVHGGEYKNIFPYQENADAMFNSSLIYELPLLKHYAEPLLRRIHPTSPAYAESLRLLKFLSYFVEMTPAEHTAVPPTSVMREFIGGSSLDY
jgi:uridine kinase